jgi:hypothetical protein
MRAQGVSSWNFDVAAIKEQAAREGGLEAALPTIAEGAPPESLPPPAAGQDPAPGGALHSFLSLHMLTRALSHACPA